MLERLTVSTLTFYANDFAWAWDSAWKYAGSRWAWGVLAGLVGASIAGGLVLTLSGTRTALFAGMIGAVGGPTVLLAGVFLCNFARYPAIHETDLQNKIAELGGAPDAPVALPRALRGSNDKYVAVALGELSDIVNNEMQGVCDKAKAALACINQIRTVQPSECATKTNDALMNGRRVLGQLSASADAGLLVAGDPQIVAVLNQAIQTKDRSIFSQFDEHARGSLGGYGDSLLYCSG